MKWLFVIPCCFLIIWVSLSSFRSSVPVPVYLDASGVGIIDPQDFIPGCSGCTADVLRSPLTNVVGCTEIGKELAVRINNPSGPNAFGTIIVIDNIPPEFISCEDDTVSCSLNPLVDPPDSFGIEVTDACGIDTIFPVFCGIQPGDCEPDGVFKSYKIRWIAKDSAGNTSNCVQMVSFRKATVSDIDFPADTTVDCDDSLLIDPNFCIPLIDSQMISQRCGLSIHSQTDTMRLCASVMMITKEFKVLDLCTFASTTETTTIMVQDTVGPQIDCPPDDTIYLQFPDCSLEYVVPDITTTNNCDDTTSLISVLIDGTLYAPGDTVLFDEKGEFEVLVKAADECWNNDTCTYYLTITDTTGPTILSCPQPIDTFITVFDENGTTCTTFDPDDIVPTPQFGDCTGITNIDCFLEIITNPGPGGMDVITGALFRFVAEDGCNNFSDTCQVSVTIEALSRITHSQLTVEERQEGIPWRNEKNKWNSNNNSFNTHEPLKGRAILFPNPATDHVLLKTDLPSSGKYSITIMDRSGNSVFRADYDIRKGEQQLEIPLKSMPGSSLYILHIEGDHLNGVYKLIVQ